MNDIVVLLNHPFGLVSLSERQGFLPEKENVHLFLLPECEDDTPQTENRKLTSLLIQQCFKNCPDRFVLEPDLDNLDGILNRVQDAKTVFMEASLLDGYKLESLQKYDNINFFVSYSDEYLLRNGKLGYPILNMMASNRLGFCKKIKSYLKEKRYLHSVSVAETAYEIARNNSLNEISVACYIAGLFHDISKDLEPSLQLEFGKNYSQDILEVEEFAYHQFASCWLCKEEFSLDHPDILNAISSHCTGKKEMDAMSMILYSADKVEPTREFPTSTLRKLCFEDYQKGFVAVLEDQIRYFRKHGIRFCGNRFTKDMYQTYLKDSIRED